MGRREAPGGTEASQGSSSAFQRVIGDPLFGRTRDGDQIFEVIETERSPITPHAGLILEWAGEGRREERTLLAAILPDRGPDVAATQRDLW